MYLGVAGGVGKLSTQSVSNGWDRWAGVFTRRSAEPLPSVTDGTSNTLMFGEMSGDYAGTFGTPPGVGGFTYSWMGATALGTAWGLPALITQHTWYRFSSFHPVTVQFANADGSVKGLRKVGVTGNGVLQLRHAAGARDGLVYDGTVVYQ
jgi:hypothetical protein